MSSTPISVDHLKAEVLPKLFADPKRVGQYGTTEATSHSNELSSLMEAGAAKGLAESIQGIVAGLADANPQQIARKPSLIDKALGRELERDVRYRIARQSLEGMIGDAETHAVGVQYMVSAIDRMLEQHSDEVERLKVLLQAGREYLAENPQAGIYVNPEMEFDRPRERFARKLANIATLLASHEMSAMQMKLARAQAVDMLDRFNETVSVLVPVWRQNTLALITTKNMSPELIASATKAHQELMRNLSSSLDTHGH